jgi:hypothetical protein
LGDYYFDIETVPKNSEDPNEKANLDPKTGKIVTIQYQRVDTKTGIPIEPLEILKEWEDSERNILEQLKPLITESPWSLIPLGYNLNFEFKFLKHKFKEYFDFDFSIDEILERPKNDLKLIGVILNNGNFKGATLDSFTDKEHSGHKIPIWYKEEKYDDIIKYVRKEAEAFLTFWQKLKKELPQLFICKRNTQPQT